MKTTQTAFLAISVAVFLAACNSTPAPDGSVTESPNPTTAPDTDTPEPTFAPTPAPFKEELVVCSFAEPDVIVGSTTYAAEFIRQAVLPTAVTYGAGYTAIPQLLIALPSAEDGTLARSSDGSLRITLNYRDDLVWSDGTPFTAADALLGLSLPTTVYDQAFDVRRVQMVGDHTLEVTVEDADYPYVPPQPPLPSHVLTEADLSMPGDLAYMRDVNPALGPYMVSEWQPGSHIVLMANPAYSGPAPAIGTVRVVFIPDAAGLATAILPGGSCDVALENGLSLDSLASLEGSEGPNGVRVHTAAWPEYERLVLNTFPDPFANNSYFADVRVRQAVAQTIDRAALSATATNGVAPVLDGWLPVDHWADNVGATSLPLDVNAAAALLDSAGWRDLNGDGVREYHGEGGTHACQRGEWQIAEDTPLAPALLTTTDPTRVLMGEQIVAMLAQIGMDVQLQTLDPTVMFVDGGPISHRTFDMALFAATIRPEPAGVGRFVGVDVYQHPHWKCVHLIAGS